MAAEGEVVAKETAFKEYAFRALKARFPDRPAFDEFYASLKDPSIQEEFLRVAAFYLFLVKEGEWNLAVEGKPPDYIPNSFKLVGLFALIESLSNEKYQDFYEWLRSKDPGTLFPISDRDALSELSEEYKDSYGSIRRCVGFFSRLPPESQLALCNAILVGGTPLASIKKVAEFLYNLRSEFVHEAKLVLEVGDSNHFSMRRDKVVETKLSMEVLLEAFEEGVLAHFQS